MSKIPLAKDVAKAIGEFAEKVDNKALLYYKFSLPKWLLFETTLDKIDDASKWSIYRIAENTSGLFNKDKSIRREKLKRNKSDQHNIDKANRDLRILDGMSKIAHEDPNDTKVSSIRMNTLLKQAKDYFGENAVTFKAYLKSRLIINQAGGVIENAGISLDRISGMPFIPGSAVKGVTRHYALWEIKKDLNSKKDLLYKALVIFGFGEQDLKKGDFCWAFGKGIDKDVKSEVGVEEFKGCLCFLPAYPGENVKIVVDMINPHTRERLVPNFFPVVKEGSEFGFAAVMVRNLPKKAEEILDKKDILNTAKRWIKSAITENGIGAKTGAGYGWFGFEPGVPKSSQQEAGLQPSQKERSSDYNEKTFENRVLKLLDDKGQWNKLSKEVGILKKPENELWLKKFKEETSKNEYKEIQKQPWYPK